MIPELKLALFLIFILLLGRSLLYILTRDKPDFSRAEKAALSFGLGIGSMALGMFYLSYAGVELNLLSVILLFSPLAVLSLIIIANDLKNTSTEFIRPNFSIKECIILLVIIYLAALVFVDAMGQPLDQYDDRAFWGLKAKILYHDSTIYSPDFFDPDRVHPHKHYPLLIPLAESMVYFFLGLVDDRLVKLIFPIFFISLLIMFYSSQRRLLPKQHSLYFTALLATLPFILVTSLPFPDAGKGPSSGYADIPLAFFYFVASICMYLWFLNPEADYYVALTAAFLVFVIFTKSEGLYLYLINLSIFFIYIFLNYRTMIRKKIILFAAVLLLPLIFLFPWFIYQNNLPSDSEIKFSIELFWDNIERLPVILRYFSFNYLHPLHWNLVFPLLIISAILTLRGSTNYRRIYLYTILLLNIISLVVMYLLSAITPIEVHLDSSFDRMMSHFMPIVIFLISINIGIYYRNITEKIIMRHKLQI